MNTNRFSRRFINERRITLCCKWRRNDCGVDRKPCCWTHRSGGAPCWGRCNRCKGINLEHRWDRNNCAPCVHGIARRGLSPYDSSVYLAVRSVVGPVPLGCCQTELRYVWKCRMGSTRFLLPVLVLPLLCTVCIYTETYGHVRIYGRRSQAALKPVHQAHSYTYRSVFHPGP